MGRRSWVESYSEEKREPGGDRLAARLFIRQQRSGPRYKATILNKYVFVRFVFTTAVIIKGCLLELLGRPMIGVIVAEYVRHDQLYRCSYNVYVIFSNPSIIIAVKVLENESRTDRFPETVRR